MKLIVLAACLTAMLATVADAASKRVERRLMQLDPMTRLEQICAIETMARVSKDTNPYRPDRAVINALSNPTLKGHTVTGSGGAFRNKGKWYQYSFTCATTPDHMTVSAFRYKIGEAIPEDKWEAYGLY